MAHLFILSAFNSFVLCMLEDVEYFYLKKLLRKVFDMRNMVSIILFSDISKCFNNLENISFLVALCSFGHFEVSASDVWGLFYSWSRGRRASLSWLLKLICRSILRADQGTRNSYEEGQVLGALLKCQAL